MLSIIVLIATVRQRWGWFHDRIYNHLYSP